MIQPTMTPDVSICFLAECLAPSCGRFVMMNSASKQALTCDRPHCTQTLKVIDACDIPRNDSPDMPVWRCEDIAKEYYEEITEHMKMFGDDDSDDFVTETFKLKGGALKNVVSAVIKKAQRIVMDRVRKASEDKETQRLANLQEENKEDAPKKRVRFA